jgi:YkoP domain
VAYLDLSRAVRGVDSLLRQRQGIEEFTDDEQCIFRISRVPAGRAVRLSDGTEIREGDPVLQLHLWNEHLPVMPSSGPSPAWAIRLKRRMRASLIAVAAYLERERMLDAVGALHGSPPFGSRLGALQMVRTAHRFGFDVIDPDASPEWRERLHLVFDSMLLWGLAYAYNPAGLKTKGLLRHRHQLWISRRKLLLRYGSCDAAPARAGRH